MSIVALAASVLALIGAGCGEGGKSSSAVTRSNQTTASIGTQSSATQSSEPAKALTKAELVAKADAICYGINAKRSAIRISKLQDYALLVIPFGAYERTAVVELNKLVPPPSLAAAWNEILAGARTQAQATAEISEYIKQHKSLDGTQSIAAALTRATHEMTTAAKREGFADCAQAS